MEINTMEGNMQPRINRILDFFLDMIFNKITLTDPTHAIIAGVSETEPEHPKLR